MSKSSFNGKAFEYACLDAVHDAVIGKRPVHITPNSSLEIARARFNQLSTQEQANMRTAAKCGIAQIIKMEPRLIHDTQTPLALTIQSDDVARGGDVRDIVCTAGNWEIGISAKHNHEALKHSRLSPHIDFGDLWFGIPCSEEYFEDIESTFDDLSEYKEHQKNWSDIKNKSDTVYVPVLNAFMTEMNKLVAQHGKDVLAGLVNYLLGSGSNDYYKLIYCKDRKTRVIPFNLKKQLNQSAGNIAPGIIIPPIKLPTRIISLQFKNASKTTLLLQMDNDWELSFRIHSASTKVEPSLKFDIKILKHPDDFFEVVTNWE